MEPFLLSVDHKPTGFTHMTFDAGATKRVNVMTLTENFHTTLDVPAETLLASLLSETRPPDRRREKG